MTNVPQNNGAGALAPFRRFFGDYKEILWYILGFGTAPLLLDFIFAVGPPWPQSTAVAAFTSVATWLVLLYSYATWDDLKKAGLRRIMQVCTPIAGLSLVVFIVLKAFLCMNAPDFRHQEAIGWELRPDVERFLKKNETDGQPTPSLPELFSGAEYKPEVIWTMRTVNTSRAGLLLSWLLLFASTSMVVSVFVLIQHFKHSQPM